MLKLQINPRFCETDALGHINNAVPLEWCELARVPLFKIFTPDLDVTKWRLIIARNEVDYLAEINFGEVVDIESNVTKIGNTSFTVDHDIIQSGQVVCRCKVVMVHFDYSSKSSTPLGELERAELAKHFRE